MKLVKKRSYCSRMGLSSKTGDFIKRRERDYKTQITM